MNDIPMNLDGCYCLAPGVAIRPERFGGLVYRYDDRRLFFLHSHALVDFVSNLDGKQPLRKVLADFLTTRELPETFQDGLLKALAQLDKIGLLTEH